MNNNPEYYIYGIPNTYPSGIMLLNTYDSLVSIDKAKTLTVPLLAVNIGNKFVDVFTNTIVSPANLITPVDKETVKVVCLEFIDNNFSRCKSNYENNILYANQKINNQGNVR